MEEPIQNPIPQKKNGATAVFGFLTVVQLLGLVGVVIALTSAFSTINALREEVQLLSNKVNAIQIQSLEADSRSEVNQFNVRALANSEMLNLINQEQLNAETPCAQVTSAIGHLAAVISTSEAEYMEYEESVANNFADLIEANRSNRQAVRNLEHIQECLEQAG